MPHAAELERFRRLRITVLLAFYVLIAHALLQLAWQKAGTAPRGGESGIASMVLLNY